MREFYLQAVISSIAFLRSREGRTLYASTKLLVSAAMENNNGSNTVSAGAAVCLCHILTM